MKNFTTNMALRDSFNNKDKPSKSEELEVLPKAIQQKIKLIEKAFR